MAEKFTYEDHQQRMRELLKPRPPLLPLAERIRGAVRRRKLPRPRV